MSDAVLQEGPADGIHPTLSRPSVLALMEIMVARILSAR